MEYKTIIDLLKKYDLLLESSDIDLSFEYVSYNSNDIRENTLFICKGFTFKKEYLLDAISKGVTCYVSETDYNLEIPCILVNDVRKALSIISLSFYKNNLYKIGITGTKGKTTTNYFVHNIIQEHLGFKPGFIATHYYYAGKSFGENHNTTPESLELQRYLNEMEESNLKYVSMEVSSQATKLSRVYGMTFNIGCFLNIGEDHISPLEHHDFDDYLNCKIQFLKMCEKVIIYKHTDYYEKIIKELNNKEIITFGMTNDCDYIIKNIEQKEKRTIFEVEHNNIITQYQIEIPGTFNVINATCAVIIGKILGINDEIINKGLIKTQVPGRMNIIYDEICPIIIDYAHNKLSAEALFKSLKQTYKDKNIKIIFGCPGDKGLNRRKDMGELAGLYADYIYLTEEDADTKSVYEICEDIAKYIKKYNKPYEIIEDRKIAIEKALDERTENDVIVITGKGDENYQIRNGVFIPYETDMVVVKEYLSKVKE